MTRLVDAAVDTAPEMLDEAAEQTGIGVTYDKTTCRVASRALIVATNLLESEDLEARPRVSTSDLRGTLVSNRRKRVKAAQINRTDDTLSSVAREFGEMQRSKEARLNGRRAGRPLRTDGESARRDLQLPARLTVADSV